MSSSTDTSRFQYWHGSVQADDRRLAQAFTERAGELRDQVEFLLSGGLNEGAVTALSALAEQDMGDFCILVDLAEATPLPTVEPLNTDTATHLQEFLDQEPWHSLAVDNDITILIAMYEDMLERQREGSWRSLCPNLGRIAGRVLASADREQFLRCSGEMLNCGGRLQPPDDLLALMQPLLHDNAVRLGLKPPQLNSSGGSPS